MTSATQIESNRANAQLSTGPKTEAGKQASKMNAFKHGLTSRQIVFPHEDANAFDELQADLFEEHDPVGPTEQMLVFDLAVCWWRLLRARRGQAQFMINTASPSGDINFIPDLQPQLAEALVRVERYVNNAERFWRRALKELQQTQAARRKLAQSLPPAPPIGFVASNSQPSEPAPSPAVAPLPAPPQIGFVSPNAVQASPPLPGPAPPIGSVSQNTALGGGSAMPRSTMKKCL